MSHQWSNVTVADAEETVVAADTVVAKIDVAVEMDVVTIIVVEMDVVETVITVEEASVTNVAKVLVITTVVDNAKHKTAVNKKLVKVHGKIHVPFCL